jgi:hypothetical protein
LKIAVAGARRRRPLPAVHRLPSALPRAAVSQARRERLLRRSALAVTVLTATIAVLAAAMAAVLLGMT